MNNSHYLRYLDAVDEDLPPACGQVLRARIEFFKAIVAGQTVRVIGQVADQREGWEQRQYEFMLGDEGIARAQVDFQDARRLDLGVPVQEAAPQPAGVFRMNRPVEWRDIDVSGRMHAAGFASLAEDAGVRVSAAHEWPLTRCAKEGFAIVLRRHEIEFGAAVTLDDELEISTWASDARRSAVIRHYLLRRRTDGAVVARFRSLYIWVSLGSGRPIRIPEIGFLHPRTARQPLVIDCSGRRAALLSWTQPHRPVPPSPPCQRRSVAAQGRELDGALAQGIRCAGPAPVELGETGKATSTSVPPYPCWRERNRSRFRGRMRFFGSGRPQRE